MPIETPRILIVDDEIHICRNCEKILSKMNCRTSYVLNGYDALTLMAGSRFDVVITDLKMSVLGGIELLRRIREEYPQTQVIIMTAYASISSAVEVMKIGAFDYLPKPFTPEELRDAVRQAMASKTGPDPHRQTDTLPDETDSISRQQDDSNRIVPTDETVPDTNEALKEAKKHIRQAAIGELEKKFLVQALIRNNWNVTRAARQTGIQRTNFQGLMKKYGIALPRRSNP